MVNHKFYEPLFEETYRYFYKEDEQGNGYLVNEFTLDDWKKYISDKTKFFKNQRVGVKAKQNTKSGKVDRRNGQEVKVAQVVDYDFDRNILTILTEPTFNFDAWTYPNGAKGTYGPNQGATKDNVYTIEVEFIDIDKWRDKPWPEISLSDWKEMMQVVDVKWNCTCMSFYWQSHRHELTTLDGAIYPYTGPDKGIWKKRHGNRSGLCKHLAAVAPLVGGFQASIVLGKIRDAAKRKGIKESVDKRDNGKYSDAMQNISYIGKKYIEYVQASDIQKHEIFEEINKLKLFTGMSVIKTMAQEIDLIGNLSNSNHNYLAKSIDNVTQPYKHELISKGWSYSDYSFIEYIDDTIKRGQAKIEYSNLIINQGREEDFWKYVTIIDTYLSRII